MRLVRIARHNWDVLAVLDDRDNCQVLDFLDGLDANYRGAVGGMLALLRQRVPIEGPPKGMPITRSLGHDIFEFRREPKGKRLRVMWFYDTGKVVVCATAFTKDADTPPDEMARAIRLRTEYFNDQRRRVITIIDPYPLRRTQMALPKYRRLFRRFDAQVGYWKEVAFTEFLVDLSQRMQDQNMTRKALADKLRCSRAAVTQALRGDANLTLDSLVRYARAVEGVLHIHISDRHSATTWRDEPWGRGIAAQQMAVDFATDQAPTVPLGLAPPREPGATASGQVTYAAHA